MSRCCPGHMSNLSCVSNPLVLSSSGFRFLSAVWSEGWTPRHLSSDWFPQLLSAFASFIWSTIPGRVSVTPSPAVLMCRQGGTPGNVRRSTVAELECSGSARSRMCPSVTFTTKYIAFSHRQVGNAMLRDKERDKTTSFIMRLGYKEDEVHCISWVLD